MRNRKYPHLLDLIATVLTLFILLLSVFLKRGNILFLRGVGAFLLLCVPILWIASMLTLKKYGRIKKGDQYYETNVVIDRGIYSLVRHPQYLAYMLLVTGFSLLTQSWIIIILSLIALILFSLYSVKEEKELELKFMNSYKDYCKRVHRFNIALGILRRINAN